jgi:hypothetical protein
VVCPCGRALQLNRNLLALFTASDNSKSWTEHVAACRPRAYTDFSAADGHGGHQSDTAAHQPMMGYPGRLPLSCPSLGGKLDASPRNAAKAVATTIP